MLRNVLQNLINKSLNSIQVIQKFMLEILKKSKF